MKKKQFLNEALNSIKTIGSIRPSSKYLIDNCLKDLSFEENQLIVEFGAGNGCITEEILKRIPSNTQLISFEINERFYKHCKNKYASYKNFTIINKSAFEYKSVIASFSKKKVDYIISSLPFSLLDKNDIEVLIDNVCDSLKNDGQFVQYQYSLGKYKFLKKKFKKIKLNFTFRNLPPTFIYNCYAN